MKFTKLWALVLALTLVLALFVGCAKTEAPAAEPSTQTSEGTESAEPAGEAAPAPEAGETAAPEASASGEQSKEPAEDGFIHYLTPGGVQYPIGDGSQSFTLWTGAPKDDDYVNSYNEAYILPHMLAATGVVMEFIEISDSAISEQFQLMIASGDWPDTMDASQRYSGGLAQAYVDEVVLDVTDLLPVYAPDYWNELTSLDETSFANLFTTTDDGDKLILGFRSISDGSHTTKGYVVRTDWLEEIGMTDEDLSTIDGFTDALYAVQEKHPEADWNLLMEDSSVLQNCVAWDTSVPDITNTSAVATYVDGGEVKSGWVADAYREYLEWFRQLYRDGIINPDYYTKYWASTTDTLMEAASGSVFCYIAGMDTLADLNLYAETPIPQTPIGYIYADDSHINNWGQELSRVGGMSTLSVSTTSEVPGLIAGYMNYQYTERGMYEANYGVEGETFTFDAEGNPHYTDLVLNSDFIANFQSACKYYTIGAHLPIYNFETKLYAAYGDDAVAAVDTWTAAYDSTDHAFPTDFYLTTDETASINNEIVDCCTYGQEMVLKFIYGQTELTDDTWQAYVDGMYSYGLQHILDVNQQVLDDTLAGTRVLDMSQMMPMGGGMEPPADAPQPGDQG